MKVQIEDARLLADRAAARLATSRGASLGVSIAKLFVGETRVHTALDAVQLHGGCGFMAEYEVERALRDVVLHHRHIGPRPRRVVLRNRPPTRPAPARR